MEEPAIYIAPITDVVDIPGVGVFTRWCDNATAWNFEEDLQISRDHPMVNVFEDIFQ